MKSRGIFPRRSGGSRSNKGGGSAGNSSSAYSPPDTDGYKAGMLGGRSSRQAGGQTLGQKTDNRPQPTDKNMTGRGGYAWDRSMSPYMTDEAKKPGP